MNRIFRPVQSPSILATLDLTDENQRRLYELIQRFHTGRWPVFRALGMKQSAGKLIEAVEWLRTSRPSFAVVYWHGDGLGLNWVDYSSKHAALTALRSL